MLLTIKRYYNINKIFMSKIGGWPSQNRFTKILMPTVITCFIFSIGFLEFIKLWETWRNLLEDCECFIILLITIGGYFKLFAIVFNSKSIERLLSLIDYHWRIFTHSLETEIMHDYAENGKKMTISYAASVYSLMIVYMLIPVMPQLLDLIKPLNESRPYKFLFDIDYSFDREEYYYVTLLHSYLTTTLTMSVMVIVDTIYIVFAQHACGLFAAIGHRLENLTLEINPEGKKKLVEKMTVAHDKRELSRLNRDDEIYRELIFILRKHQLSIEYVGLLDSSFAIYSLVMLLINIVCTSLLGIQILSLMDHKEEMARFVAMIIGTFFHLFVLSYPGQRIMDHSADLFHKAYNIQWYKMSQRSTQLLKILLYRCFVPCTLTAGKIYVLSMANYASMVQASLSYFTTFSSFN